MNSRGPCVQVSADRLAAFLDLSDPDAPAPSLVQIRADAAAAGVVHGLIPGRIELALEMRARLKSLPRPTRIAEGTAPTPARDSVLDFDLGVAPDDPGDARIDFHDLRRFVSVAAGRRIGLWSPAVPGVPGLGVDGVEIPIEAPREVAFEAVENIVLRDLGDGRFAIEAAVDGAVVIGGGNRISVVNVLRIEGDVDFSTGNIDAKGSVIVTGSVRGSFQLRATQDVSIQGTVEDAIVEAGGTVTVGGGILGGEFGHVRAGRGISAQHAQNARIASGGDVVLRESDLGSTIEASGVLRAAEGHGRLSGGSYTAARAILARELGSPMGVPTALRVGLDPALERELETARRLLSELIAQAEHQQQLAAADPSRGMSSDRARSLREGARARLGVQAELAQLDARRAELDRLFDSDSPPCVHASKAVHGCVTIEIRGARCVFQEQTGARRFVVDPETGELVADAG